jgi:hypothetical protein
MVVLCRCSLLAAAALLLPAASAFPQRLADPANATVTVLDAGGEGPDLDLRTVRRGFDLFGSSDYAVAGFPMTGYMAVQLSNAGDCENTYSTYQCQYMRQLYQPTRGVYAAPFFEVEWAVAAPPNEYRKIREVAPSVANATGEGWTGGYSARVLGRPPWFGPADGTLGQLFSGVTTTRDGSCRDRSSRAAGFGYWAAGYQLLATSDCPETWGSEGWQGARSTEPAVWETLFAERGDAFRFDFWRVDAGETSNRAYLGTGGHTYGEASDYSSNVLPYYGKVVPGGLGAPTRQGYPLGLLLRFDAFTFTDPRLANAYFVQVLIINRSADVWGTGVDYDSLYLGFSNGTLFQMGANSRYALPDRGMVLYHQSNVQGPGGPCDDAYRRPDGGACVSNAYAGRGYGLSALALFFLKSPLGDLRNKLFTRTASGAPCTVGQDPFCSPVHPLRGDTLTFNRQAFGNYSSAVNYTFYSGAKPTFGYMAANEQLTHNGRNPAEQTANTLWTVFRSEDWTTRRDYYNKYVPPASPPWDYNHDGIPDTLALATCGRYGCAVVDADTMPGGWVNRRGNTGGLQSFGPFALAAGDTTALVYAMAGGGDSADVWAQIDAVLEHYLNLYAAPQPPPPARVLSTTVTPGTDAFGSTPAQVRLAFSDDPVHWVDPWLTKAADDVESAAPETPLGTLRLLNDGSPIVVMVVDTLPGPVYDTTFIKMKSTNLVSALRERAAANFARLEIYKSCDAGQTWTSDADCRGDPASDVDGQPLGLGWKTYASYAAGGGTMPPTVFVDAKVQAGRTYRYAIIGQSRGATFVLNTETGQTPVTFAPSLRNPLPFSPSDPNLADVYVPVSRPAGYEAARATVTGAPVGATVPFTIDLTEQAEAGTFRAIFGNQLLVRRDSLLSSGAVARSTVTIQRRRRVVVPGAPAQDSTLEAQTFEYPFPGVFPVAGAATGASDTTIGDTVRTTTWYYALSMLLAGPEGPVFGSRQLTGTDATPVAVFGTPLFPGFTITADNTLATAFKPAGERQVRGPTSLASEGLAASDTVVPRDVVDRSMVQWQEDLAWRRAAADGVGRYEIAWQDDPFGLADGLTLDPADAASTGAALLAALDGRVTASVARTDSTAAALLGVDQADLVPLALPFTVWNRTFDRSVMVVAPRRVGSAILLGSGADTTSVDIPEDVWIPGHALAFLEDIREDSLDSGGRLVLDSLSRPVQRVRTAVSFSRTILGCDAPRLTCNPLRDGTPGATGYTPMHAGDRTEFEYYAGFPETGAFTFDVRAAVAGSAITAVTDSALRLIRVVPNPFVLYSSYQSSLEEPRLVFTHMPPTGTLRIYTVAGQFVQQITWGPEDLEGDGDLYWNLRTREGGVVASGLYIWALTAPSNPNDPASAPLQARGKFVIVR